MKIAQFVHGYPPEFIGGTESYTRALSERLVRRGCPCLVIAGSAWRRLEPPVVLGEDGGVNIARLIGLSRRKGLRPAAYDATVDSLVRKLLDWWRPEVVHIHHWSRLTNNLVAICCELAIPVVVTLHDQWIACSRYHRFRPEGVFCAERIAPCVSCVDRDLWQPFEEIERELTLRERAIQRELQLADRLLVPSRAQQAFLHTIGEIPLGRLEVVPLGSLQERMERFPDHRQRSSGEPIKAGHWGYLLPEKGVHLLLEAARRLSSATSVEWHVYGTAPDPAYQARLTKLAEGLPVIFHGSYSFQDLQSVDLDLAVFPSLCCETHSFVLDEAFRLGLPVLASNRGAFRERVGSAGVLFACGDVDDLAAQLESLLKKPEILGRLKEEARGGQQVVSMDDHVRHIEKMYQEVVDSYVPGEAPDHHYRELLLHHQQQVIDREREIERLKEAEADLRVEMEAEASRLLKTIATLEEEREWWRRQAQRLGHDVERLEKTPFNRLHSLLTGLKSPEQRS